MSVLHFLHLQDLDPIDFNAEDVAGLAKTAHLFLHCVDGVRSNCDRFGAVLLCQHIICQGLGGEGLFCCTPPGLVILPRSEGIMRKSTHAEAGANRFLGAHMHALWAMSITHETMMFGNTPRAGCSISKAV